MPAISGDPRELTGSAGQPMDASAAKQAGERSVTATELPGQGQDPSKSRVFRSVSAIAVTAEDPLRSLLWLVTLMLGFGALVFLGVMAYFGRAHDRAAIAASAAVVRSALEVRERELSQIVRDIAWTDDAVALLALDIDPAWADAAIGSKQVEANSINASFVIDGSNRTTLAFVHGQPSHVDAFGVVSDGLDDLIAYTRDSPRGTLRAAAGFLLFEGQPHLVVACAITPEPSSTPWPYGLPKSVIVFARLLDPAFLSRLGSDFHINDLQLVHQNSASLGAALTLTNTDGLPVGILTWSPDLPARDLIVGAAPVAAGVAAVMVALYWLFAHRTHSIGVLLARQARIIDHVHEGVVLTDPFGIISGWNAGAARMFGYSRAEVMGRSAAMLLASADAAPEVDAIARSFDSGREFADLELLMRRKNGESFPAQLLLAPIRDTKHRTAGTIGYHLDISERKKLEERLEKLATIDELTGAYNRRFLLDHGPVEIERARRFKRQVSFLFIDLDRFKSVNDRFGHSFGDLVLSTFAQTCRNVLRPSDMLVRYGGEEFVVVLPETSQDQAVAAATRLADRLRETVFSVNPPYRGLTISVGVTTLRDSDKGIEEILGRADKATYRAKELGRDRIELAA